MSGMTEGEHLRSPDVLLEEEPILFVYLFGAGTKM